MSVRTGAALLALAFLMRLAHLLSIHDTPLFDVPIGDGIAYTVWAKEIAAGNWIGQEVFYQAPFYPYFLATVYKLLGDGDWAPRLVQIGLGSISCLLLALAGRRFFSARVGVLAGVAFALYAPAIYYDGLLQKASLGLFFSAALLFLLGELMERPRRLRALGTGVLLGCFALTRENSLILIPLVALWLWFGFGDANRAREWRWPSALMLGAALVLVPVGLRNHAIGGRFLITTSQLGPNFFIGNNPRANGKYKPLRVSRGSPRFERADAHALAERALGRSLGPAEVSSYWLERSLAFIREQPGDWLALLAHKWFLVWHAQEIIDTESIEAYREESPVLDLLARLLHFGVIAPAALLGLWATREHWRRLWLLHGILFGCAVSVAAFYVLGRYRVSMVPVLLLFAACGLLKALSALRERRVYTLATGIFLVAGAAIASNWPLERGRDPGAITLYALGAGLREAGRSDEALRVLEGVVERAPTFADAKVVLGHTLLEVGRLDEAVDHFRGALRLDPNHAGSHSGLGAALIVQGDVDSGIAELRRALDLEPDLSDANNHLANELVKRGKMQEAIAHYHRALRTRPGNADIESNLALAYAALGRLDEALASFDALLAATPRHPRTLFNRALILEALGRRDEAISGYRRALDLAPTSETGVRQAATEGIVRLSDGSGNDV